MVAEGSFPGIRTARDTKPDRFADYLLVNDAVRGRRFDVLQKPAVSDYCPLVLQT